MAKQPLVGSLLYLTLTRLDIYYHMSILCSFIHDPSPMLTMPLFTKHYRLTLVARLDPPSGVDPRFHSSIDTLGGLIAYAVSSWRNPVKLGYKCFGHVVYLHGGLNIYVAEKL